jgi:hypothetical protein
MALPSFSPATFSNQSTKTTMAAGSGTAATGTALSSRGANNDVFQQQQQQQQRRMISSATADTAKELVPNNDPVNEPVNDPVLYDEVNVLTDAVKLLNELVVINEPVSIVVPAFRAKLAVKA